MANITGLPSVRAAIHDLLRYTDKYGRRLRDHVPDEKLLEFDEALRKIVEGCETLRKMKFKGE